MSSYEFKAKNKETGEEAIVYARDDHFGRHRYGYMIEGNVAMTEDQFNQYWERIEVTPEKETPVYTTTYAFGVVPDTPKTVEEVVEEFDHKFFDSDFSVDVKTGAKFCGCYEGDIGDIFPGTRDEVLDWLRTTLLAQNQAADERLREVFSAILEEQTTFDNYNNTQTYAGVLVADIRRIAKEHGITNL